MTLSRTLFATLLISMAIAAIAPFDVAFTAAELFRRFGFMTAEIASVGCHTVLQPALGWLI